MTTFRNSALVGGAFAAAVMGFVRPWEGRSLVAYRDVVGVVTICDGDTKNVRMGQKATNAECDDRLVKRLIEHEDGMNKCLRVAVPDKVRLAFLDFTYNEGVGAFCKSTLARKANAGDLRGACYELLNWTSAGGKEYAGLVRRRDGELKRCLEGVEGR